LEDEKSLKKKKLMTQIAEEAMKKQEQLKLKNEVIQGKSHTKLYDS